MAKITCGQSGLLFTIIASTNLGKHGLPLSGAKSVQRLRPISGEIASVIVGMVAMDTVGYEAPCLYEKRRMNLVEKDTVKLQGGSGKNKRSKCSSAVASTYF